MTWNGYRQNGGLSGGYSYAAEIMPEEIVANAVSFAINKTPGNNAVVCKVIQYPFQPANGASCICSWLQTVTIMT